jgi:hypothetical protein
MSWIEEAIPSIEAFLLLIFFQGQFQKLILQSYCAARGAAARYPQNRPKSSLDPRPRDGSGDSPTKPLGQNPTGRSSTQNLG